MDFEFLSNLAGFVGSLLLFIPGWEASKQLRRISKINNILKAQKGTQNDPGEELKKLHQENLQSWKRSHHLALTFGIFLIFVSFAFGIYAQQIN